MPREDEHQGEYVPAANERLKYISGFGGRPARRLLARKAALFVDGRRILQAPKQTDTKLYSIVDIMQPFTQWLAATVKKGMEIGLDPRLHSETAVKTYRDRLLQKGRGWCWLMKTLMLTGTTGLNCRTRRWSADALCRSHIGAKAQSAGRRDETSRA